MNKIIQITLATGNPNGNILYALDADGKIWRMSEDYRLDTDDWFWGPVWSRP